MRNNLPPVANPGASATVIIYDDGAKPAGTPQYPTRNTDQEMRVNGVVNADVIVNIQQMWAIPGGTLRQVSITPTVANTPKPFDLPLYPGRNVVQIVTTTAPTVWEVAAQTADKPTTV